MSGVMCLCLACLKKVTHLRAFVPKENIMVLFSQTDFIATESHLLMGFQATVETMPLAQNLTQISMQSRLKFSKKMFKQQHFSMFI